MRDTIDINSNDNALFITSQCNNRCVMCCQPPLLRNDLDGYFQKNKALIDSAPRELRSLGITGGEPTLLGDRLFELLRHIRTKLPETEIHLLTNGRAFADKEYARKLSFFVVAFSKMILAMGCKAAKRLYSLASHSQNR